MDFKLTLHESKGELPTEPEMYQRLLGRLIYLTLTQPDISFVFSLVSQFMHAPWDIHHDDVYHILRFIKDGASKGMVFHRYGHFYLSGYTNANRDLQMRTGQARLLIGDLPQSSAYFLEAFFFVEEQEATSSLPLEC